MVYKWNPFTNNLDDIGPHGSSNTAIDEITVQAHTAPGTSPVLANSSGNINVNGTIVAAHSIPIQSDSLAANTFNIEVQYASAIAATDGTKVGMAAFNSADFSVDATGFVTVIGTSNARLKFTTPGAYPYTTLANDQVILVDSSAPRTINLIASPATGQTYYIKDNVGSAGTNAITITPNAGNIDGAGSATMNINYGCAQIVYNGTSWGFI